VREWGGTPFGYLVAFFTGNFLFFLFFILCSGFYFPSGLLGFLGGLGGLVFCLGSFFSCFVHGLNLWKVKEGGERR
jgi:hypothetical protein